MLVADFVMLALAVPFILLVIAGYVLIAAGLRRCLRERLTQGADRATAHAVPQARLVYWR